MNFHSSHLSTTRKQTIFPLLIEEAITINPGRIIASFPAAGINSKRLVKEPRSTNDAFPPGRSFRNTKFLAKGLSSTKNFDYGSPKEATVCKDYSCPNIVDMNDTIFYHGDVETRNRPRPRIIDGFFPHKIRSGGGWTNSTWTTAVNGGTWPQYGQSQRTSPQVGMWLGVTSEPEKIPRVANAPPTGMIEGPRKKIERPKSIFTSNGDLTEHFNIRKSYSAWPARNGGSPPWLERYKIKKRSTTSYDLQRPQNSNNETSNRTTRNQEYVNLSCAYIQDAF